MMPIYKQLLKQPQPLQRAPHHHWILALLMQVAHLRPLTLLPHPVTIQQEHLLKQKCHQMPVQTQHQSLTLVTCWPHLLALGHLRALLQAPKERNTIQLSQTIATWALAADHIRVCPHQN
jgi:hypothetical protein